MVKNIKWIKIVPVVLFALILSILLPSLPLFNSLSEAQDQDPFAGKNIIINPAWGLKKIPNYTWGSTGTGDSPVIEDSITYYPNIPKHARIIRGERWYGDSVALGNYGINIGICVYRFNSIADAREHLNGIFKPAFFTSLQNEYTRGNTQSLADADKGLKPSTAVLSGGGPDCRTQGFVSAYEREISQLTGVDFAYVWKYYTWTAWFLTHNVKRADGKYDSISEGGRLDRILNNETRGFYLIDKEYLMLIQVGCRRMTSTDTGGCNNNFVIQNVPYREDIWKSVTAGKTETGYCGDQKCQKEKDESCLTCEQDCKCASPEICDPFSKFTNPDTKCSPKVACIYTNNHGLDGRHLAAIHFRKKHIIKFFQDQRYQIITYDVFKLDDVMETMANPSTKAIAYFGHAIEPAICDSDAIGVQNSLFMTLKSKYMTSGLKDEDAIRLARARSDMPNLDYAYMFTCHSFDNMSLANYLLRSGGIYWGETGILTGTLPLSKYIKP